MWEDELAFRYNTCTMKHFRYRVSGMLARIGGSALWHLVQLNIATGGHLTHGKR